MLQKPETKKKAKNHLVTLSGFDREGNPFRKSLSSQYNYSDLANHGIGNFLNRMLGILRSQAPLQTRISGVAGFTPHHDCIRRSFGEISQKCTQFICAWQGKHGCNQPVATEVSSLITSFPSQAMFGNGPAPMLTKVEDGAACFFKSKPACSPAALKSRVRTR